MRGNEQGDILIKSATGARRRIRALRFSARNKRAKERVEKKHRNVGPERAGGLPESKKEREQKSERERERAYEKPWQLAKSPGSAPGENYSRYEFTVGAGGCRVKEERRRGRVGGLVQRIVVESPG